MNCLAFLLERFKYPGEIENNAHANFGDFLPRCIIGNVKMVNRPIDIFSLYILFSQLRPRDFP